METRSDELRMQAAFSVIHPDATFHETSGEVVGPRWAEWKSFKDGWYSHKTTDAALRAGAEQIGLEIVQ